MKKIVLPIMMFVFLISVASVLSASQETIPLLNISRSDAEFCNPFINSPTFFGRLRAATIPTPTVEFSDLSCRGINFWKWIVNIEEDTEGFSVVGIRIYLLVSVVVASLLTTVPFFVKRLRLAEKLVA